MFGFELIRLEIIEVRRLEKLAFILEPGAFVLC